MSIEFVAQFRARCADCDQVIEVGEPVAAISGDGYHHDTRGHCVLAERPCPCCLGDRGTVCDACGQHACWAGQFMCEDAHGAGVTTERAEVRDAQ